MPAGILCGFYRFILRGFSLKTAQNTQALAKGPVAAILKLGLIINLDLRIIWDAA